MPEYHTACSASRQPGQGSASRRTCMPFLGPRSAAAGPAALLYMPIDGSGREKLGPPSVSRCDEKPLLTELGPYMEATAGGQGRVRQGTPVAKQQRGRSGRTAAALLGGGWHAAPEEAGTRARRQTGRGTVITPCMLRTRVCPAGRWQLNVRPTAYMVPRLLSENLLDLPPLAASSFDFSISIAFFFMRSLVSFILLCRAYPPPLPHIAV